jgi:hypothetical protein
LVRRMTVVVSLNAIVVVRRSFDVVLYEEVFLWYKKRHCLYC